MLISILIPVRDNPEGINRALTALSRQDLSNCEVIVADDGSTSPLRTKQLPQLDCPIKCLRLAGKGPATARNLMALQAQGEYLLFMDSDVEPAPDLMEKIQEKITGGPPVSAFFGSYDASPEAPGLISRYRNLLHHFVHHNHRGPVASFWCGCGVVRKQLFIEMGGFCTRFQNPSIEDIEFGARLSKRGIQVLLHKDVQVKHLKSWSLKNWLSTDLFRRGLPWVELMRKEGWMHQLNFSRQSKLSALAALILFASPTLLLWHPGVAALTAVSALLIFVLVNLRLFGLFLAKEGFIRCLAMVPLHLLYNGICILAFVITFLRPGPWPAKVLARLDN